MSVTINDVARLSGVSKRTVSRVINCSPAVGEATRERVLEIIKETGFSPDKQARGLASSRSYLLGLIYDNPDALYIDQVQRGALSVCAELGYELVVHPGSSKHEDFIDDCLRFISRSKLDGVIILPPVSENKALAAALREAECPYVRLASVDLDDADNIVVSDERAAMRDMASHLVELGHTDIGFISGPQHFRSSTERLAGFLAELQVYNVQLPDSRIVEGKNNYESGLMCAQTLLDTPNRPTAIVANNDEMAAAALRVASNLNIKVPDELSVAGFDDNILASRIIPSLTTIRRPVYNMACLAVQKLINKSRATKEKLPLQKTVTPTLVKRESTGQCSE
ncbi:LacI family DNA-binding transcriptional regulator [Pseudoalteromonas fuliginea]|uniref:LacI family DNA-binding transcriptional regulator n=1 Tax=Pseudoalteromonas fuliginea TaxID=1872678 RepID=A0AB73BBR8_9GAMM|nr:MULTISPECIES: LacI family DNA-binding transcriptional regulator [Pseudoalteromonas]KAA1156811.1 LacI family DNA-binding transcriptional regulator [Pseudoalteromonas fuliginea]GAA78412.1 LacI family transcriptional regulator [Pseudoalteromonas sp. BSi20495]